MSGAPKTILVATDLEDRGAEVLRTAAFSAESFGAALHVFHACDISAPAPPIPVPGTAALRREALDEATDEVREAAKGFVARVLPQGANVTLHVVRGSDAGAAACEAASSLPADLMVVGSHGRSGLGRVLLGSVAERVVRHAPCPVLVIRQRD
jgi:universal stress protein A